MCDGKPPTSLPVPSPGTAGEVPPRAPCFCLRSLRSLCLALLIPTSLLRLERIPDPRPTDRQGRGRFPLRRPRPKATPPPLTSAVRQPTPPTDTEFVPRIASEAFFRVHPSHHTTQPEKTLGNLSPQNPRPTPTAGPGTTAQDPGSCLSLLPSTSPTVRPAEATATSPPRLGPQTSFRRFLGLS